MANLSRVLYDNKLADALSVTYSGTEVDGFNYQNATDYKDFSTFKPQVSATTQLDYTVDGSGTLNAIGIYVKKVGASGLDIKVYYESAPSTYTLLDTILDADGELSLSSFSGVSIAGSRNIRLEFISDATQYEIRQISVGASLQMERGQYAGVNPPTLAQGIVQSNNISENGAILGTNVKRVDVKSSIDLMYLTESWVRNTWEPFALSASKGRSFFYQWNPDEYPDEVVFCVASKINPPKNITPTPLMSVSMPIICRQPDP